MELRSNRCAKLRTTGGFSGDASSEALAVSSSLLDSGNSEIGRTFFGMNRQPATITARVKVMTRMIEAGDQIVEPSVMIPVLCWRKWPGVAMSSGALAERPNCQTAPAPASVANINRKSTPMPLRSASLQK